MNTIEEIIKFKNQKCSKCKNKNNKEDLCNITKTIDNAYNCVNYEKCMKNRCKTCNNVKLCDLENTTRKIINKFCKDKNKIS